MTSLDGFNFTVVRASGGGGSSKAVGFSHRPGGSSGRFSISEALATEAGISDGDTIELSYDAERQVAMLRIAPKGYKIKRSEAGGTFGFSVTARSFLDVAPKNAKMGRYKAEVIDDTSVNVAVAEDTPKALLVYFTEPAKAQAGESADAGPAPSEAAAA